MHVKSAINTGSMTASRNADREKARLVAYNEGFKKLMEKAMKDAEKVKGGTQ